MAKKKVVVAKSKLKANKKKAITSSFRADAGKARLKPRAKAAALTTATPGNDYAIWGITFYHYDPTWNYYYPIYDDQIDSSLELYVMGEATPETFQDTDLLAKIDLPNGTNVVGEAAAPHYDPTNYPSSWIATIAANSLNAGTSYVFKIRHYLDLAAASSEFATIASMSPPPPSGGA